MRRLIVSLQLLSVFGYSLAQPCFSAELSGFVGAQQRWFYDTALSSDQSSGATSLNIEPEWYIAWNNGNDSLTITPYLRLDSADNERSHFDIRELYWLHADNNWELGVGLSKVYWGVAESQHLVDIINQTDLVEAPDGEEKLGQPMLRWSTSESYGTIDLFILPGFRERTFAGRQGRLRGQIVVDTSHAEYESGAKQTHVDIAARWAHNVGNWDIGLSFFKGTSREPAFIVKADTTTPTLLPYYEQIDQYGIDAQLTTGSWLWKFEGISRQSNSTDFNAITGGFEYTFYSLFDGLGDLGLLAEYSFDSRDEETTTGLQNDAFIGARFGWNDSASSELLMGLTQDLDNSRSVAAKMEAATRIGAATKVNIEAWFFTTKNPQDPLYAVRQDSFIELSVAYYF